MTNFYALDLALDSGVLLPRPNFLYDVAPDIKDDKVAFRVAWKYTMKFGKPCKRLLKELVGMKPSIKQEEQWLDMVHAHLPADDMYAHLSVIPYMVDISLKHPDRARPLMEYLLSLPIDPALVQKISGIYPTEFHGMVSTEQMANIVLRPPA